MCQTLELLLASSPQTANPTRLTAFASVERLQHRCDAAQVGESVASESKSLPSRQRPPLWPSPDVRWYHVENILLIVVVVLIVLFVLGYFGRGRLRG